ncbi:MAG TPA: NIL domain-containing protein [Candidatus Limnocylindrales bacterium]|nr:NIL domain-containing protein [Candidatus Limnocylindrales bacterium]
MPRAVVRLTFRGEVFKDPVLYQMGKDYHLVTNIRRAHVDQGEGWLEVELDGQQADIDAALEYCRSRGITVERDTPS